VKGFRGGKEIIFRRSKKERYPERKRFFEVIFVKREYFLQSWFGYDPFVAFEEVFGRRTTDAISRKSLSQQPAKQLHLE